MIRYNLKTEAEKLLRENAPGVYPVPVIKIAESLNAFVYSDNMPDWQNGYLALFGNEIRIVNNKNQSTGRRRFTIAHEIEHLLFDRDYFNAHGVIDRDGDALDPSYRSREQRANLFAAELLMPEADFIRQWGALRDSDKVADYFHVSKQAAYYRAANLGIVQVI